jgi:hypothetical protein
MNIARRISVGVLRYLTAAPKAREPVPNPILLPTSILLQRANQTILNRPVSIELAEPPTTHTFSARSLIFGGLVIYALFNILRR